MNFLIKLFIKDYKNTTNESVRGRYGTFAGVVGIITNTLLVIIKLVIGIISASIALIADAINNLSDALSSIITIVGFKLSQKGPDEKHPFGHERIEYITSLLIAIVILIIGGNFLITSIKKCINPTPVEFSLTIIILLGVSILVKLWQGLFYVKIAKIINSTALRAAARDSFSDTVVTTSVLFSTLIMYFNDVNIDGYMGILVSIFILYNGFKTVLESTSPLIGELPEKVLVNEMLETILINEKIKGYHDLEFHMYGPSKLYSSIHLEFDYKDDILEIHEIIDKLEREVYTKFNIKLVVHMDPVVYDDELTNNYYEIVKRLISNYDPDIDFHDFRVIKGENRNKILFDCVLPHSYYNRKFEIKKELQQLVEATINDCECIIVLDTKLVFT